MDLMICIKELLQKEDIINLFAHNDLEVLTTNNWFRLRNKKTKAIERLKITLNEKSGQITFQGTNIEFILNHDNNNELYLEQLILKENNIIKFIMVHKISLDDETIIIEFTDNDYSNHHFILKKDSLDIEKNSFTFSHLILGEGKIDMNKDLNDQIKSIRHTTKYNLYKAKDGTIKSSTEKENYYCNIFNEFIELEKIFPSITTYLKTKIPFIEDCIEKATNYNYKNNKNNKIKININEVVKTYKIKRSKAINEKEVDEIIAKAKRKQLIKINKNNEQ